MRAEMLPHCHTRCCLSPDADAVVSFAPPMPRYYAVTAAGYRQRARRVDVFPLLNGQRQRCSPVFALFLPPWLLSPMLPAILATMRAYAARLHYAAALSRHHCRHVCHALFVCCRHAFADAYFRYATRGYVFATRCAVACSFQRTCHHTIISLIDDA